MRVIKKHSSKWQQQRHVGVGHIEFFGLVLEMIFKKRVKWSRNTNGKSTGYPFIIIIYPFKWSFKIFCSAIDQCNPLVNHYVMIKLVFAAIKLHLKEISHHLPMNIAIKNWRTCSPGAHCRSGAAKISLQAGTFSLGYTYKMSKIH